jgi:hypothetical protein
LIYEKDTLNTSAVKPEFEHASETFKKLNPHLFGVCEVEADKSKPASPPALDRRKPKQTRGVGCVVTLVAVVARELDSDNLQGSLKPLRDCIAATIGADDGSPWFRWQYTQVVTCGEQGVIVKIELKV